MDNPFNIPRRIALGKMPEVILPPGFERPEDVKVWNFAATDWHWTGENVALIKLPYVRIVAEGIEMLKNFFMQGVLRPLRADEMTALAEYKAEWPLRWREAPVGTLSNRVFFAGTVYEFSFGEQEISVDVVWCARPTDSDWEFDTVCAEVPLRKGDEFACVALDPSALIAEPARHPPMPPQRRMRVKRLHHM